ncbi:DUF2752 domain-containing protein [Actinomadura flavalba]|uniref:DUF2752 domain-containing protein n=1 Tax=Actinomadura flavalba TaxID=1120938 RepID=UPI001F0AD6D8|nr:DUF2752 domain-containing protein [Actinomadura flavalba]
MPSPGRIAAVLDAARQGPSGVLLRGAVMAGAAVVVAWVHGVSDPGVLCPLRAVTGIPCPLCGGTTVFVEMGSGRPVRALLANPVVLVGAVLFALAPLGWGNRWWALPPKARGWVLGTVLVGSELWQLARFGLMRV